MKRPGMRLRSRRVGRRTTWEVVEVELPSGGIGYGECSDSLDLAALPGIFDQIATIARAGEHGVFDGAAAEDGFEPNAWSIDRLRGLDGALVDYATAADDPRARHARRVASSGLITALCDLAAQAAGDPLWRWLGGSAGDCGATCRVALYANVNRAPRERTPQQFAQVAAAAVDDGFRTVKLAPFDGPRIDDHSLAATGVAHVEAVRSAIGDDVDVLVDLHHKLSEDELLNVLPALEKAKVGWLEDAVDVRDKHAMAWLADHTDLPIAGGEKLVNDIDIVGVADAGLLSWLLLDVKFVGGPLRFASLVPHATDLRLSLHDPTGPLSTALSLHASTLHPGPSLIEYAHGEPIERGPLVEPPERITDGEASLPSSPGIGVRLNPATWTEESLVGSWHL